MLTGGVHRHDDFFFGVVVFAVSFFFGVVLESDDDVSFDVVEPPSLFVSVDDEESEPDDESDESDDLESDELESEESPLDAPRLSFLKNPVPRNVTPTGWKTFLTAIGRPVSGCLYFVSVSSVNACWTSIVSPVFVNL